MKEDKPDYHPLFVTALLICAGLFSPSNSVDDRTFKTPLETLSFMLIAICVGVTAFLIWKLAGHYRALSKANRSTNL